MTSASRWNSTCARARASAGCWSGAATACARRTCTGWSSRRCSTTCGSTTRSSGGSADQPDEVAGVALFQVPAGGEDTVGLLLAVARLYESTELVLHLRV